MIDIYKAQLKFADAAKLLDNHKVDYQYYNLACIYASGASNTDIQNGKSKNYLNLCKENLKKAIESGELNEFTIQSLIDRLEFKTFKEEAWFLEIMRDLFRTKARGNHK